MSVDLVALKVAETKRWRAMRVHPDHVAEFDAVARRLVAPAAKTIYQQIATMCGMPDQAWPFIAVVHEREASGKWTANIGQGDPWNERSRNVPLGRGPFKSFIAAACDALMKCAPYA